MTRATIRLATAGDLPAILAIERCISELPHWNEAEYCRYLSVDAGVERCLLVAEDDEYGELAGFAAAAVHREAAVAELESVAVLSGSRRGGLGRRLCGAAVEWCRVRDAAAVDLEVRAGSDDAIALYHSLGFAVVGRRKGYYANPADDAVLMSLVFPLVAAHL